MLILFRLCVFCTMLILPSCAVQRPPIDAERIQKVQPESQHAVDKAWYAVRFKIPWDTHAEPAWSVGTLIAGEIIDPFLQQHQYNIGLWRFHRRAVPDDQGHMFSFIFYASAVDAANTYQQLVQHSLIATLIQQKQLLTVQYDHYSNKKIHIADTSDPDWPNSMRQSWPYFMMGVSRMWLEQINALQKKFSTGDDMLQRYTRIQSKLTELWQQDGQHALMHHLNAVYAYQPVFVRF